MQMDLGRINADAAADGLADYTALERFLGDTAQIKSMFDRWESVFPPMEHALNEYQRDPSQATRSEFLQRYTAFIEASKVNNKKFVMMCLDKYRAELEVQ